MNISLRYHTNLGERRSKSYPNIDVEILNQSYVYTIKEVRLVNMTLIEESYESDDGPSHPSHSLLCTTE